MTLLDNILDLLPGSKEEPPEKLPEAKADFEDYASPPIRQNEDHACKAYTDLKTRFRDIGRMNAIIEALGRDFLTAMPDGAYRSRLGQIAFLYRRMHEDTISGDVCQLLDKAQEHEYAQPDNWDEWDRANLREMAGLYRKSCHVNPELMERKARLSYVGRKRHYDIKQSGDWDQAKDFLYEQIELHREIADARCSAEGEDKVSSHYEMLMQDYLPGMSVFQVENLFESYDEAVSKMLPDILKKQKKDDTPDAFADMDFDAEAQMWLNRSLLEVIGFDFDRGGLYETGHNPVEGGTPDDTRLVISTVDDENFLDSMKSALHEGGHGIYIQGLPRQSWRYQPVAMDLGAGIHESQALLIEMIIGRMLEFFEFISPRLEGLFHGIHNEALSPENLFALKTRVAKTPDRKRADEVTYFYHILLRFRLERDLIDRALKVEDLPEAWVEGIHDLLGVYPENHLEGCLQDVHWFVGKFGYFPSYSIGHMIGAQFFETLNEDIDDLPGKIAAGEFADIKQWLLNNIYSKGRLYNMQELVKNVTGKHIRPDYLEKHIKRRYLS